MYDRPDKVAPLMRAMQEALPIEVALTAELLDHLRSQPEPFDVSEKEFVSSVDYAGDQGGFMCRIVPAGTTRALVISLTHLRVRPTSAVNRAIIDYQRHRIKKLKKFHGSAGL